jgi:hypothetical protein
MKENKSAPNILLVAGPNSKYKLPGVKPAGFLVGVWHGIIAAPVFVIGLFTPNVAIYETHNNGRWYDFGFLLGIGAFSGSVTGSSS